MTLVEFAASSVALFDGQNTASEAEPKAARVIICRCSSNACHARTVIKPVFVSKVTEGRGRGWLSGRRIDAARSAAVVLPIKIPAAPVIYFAIVVVIHAIGAFVAPHSVHAGFARICPDIIFQVFMFISTRLLSQMAIMVFSLLPVDIPMHFPLQYAPSDTAL